MTHPDETTPDLDPNSDVYTQLHTLIDWAQCRLDDEHANRQIALEQLIEHLADVARRADRRGMSAVAGSGATVIQVGGNFHGNF